MYKNIKTVSIVSTNGTSNEVQYEMVSECKGTWKKIYNARLREPSSFIKKCIEFPVQCFEQNATISKTWNFPSLTFEY